MDAMNDPPHLIRRLVIQNAIWVAALGALLFVPAGTLRWPAAWLLLAAIGGLGLAGGLWFAHINPGLLAERMRPMMQKDQPAADKTFMMMLGPTAMLWLIAIGLDHRYRASDMALGVQAAGFVLFLLSLAISTWVMLENTFAAPVIKIQSERGHRVVSSGPYAIVRHPMYGGVIFFFVGVALLLGSWWGLALTPLLVALFAVRAVIEERTLVAGLPGYSDYMRRVRYRLIPGLW